MDPSSSPPEAARPPVLAPWPVAVAAALLLVTIIGATAVMLASVEGLGWLQDLAAALVGWPTLVAVVLLRLDSLAQRSWPPSAGGALRKLVVVAALMGGGGLLVGGWAAVHAWSHRPDIALYAVTVGTNMVGYLPVSEVPDVDSMVGQPRRTYTYGDESGRDKAARMLPYSIPIILGTTELVLMIGPLRRRHV